MRYTTLASAISTLTLLATLAACGSPTKPAPTPQRSESAPAGPTGVVQPRVPAEACTREGESCKAAGAVCCPGLICTGSASGICISAR